MRQDFEEWLAEYHAENSEGILDDDMPDAFEDFICNIDPDYWIKLAQKYADKMYKQGHTDAMKGIIL